MTTDPAPYSPRALVGLIRRAGRGRIALAVRLDASARNGHAVAVVDLPRAAALRFARRYYGSGRRIDACWVLGTLVIG